MIKKRIRWQLWIGFFALVLLLYVLGNVLTPFVIAGLIAYLVNPLVLLLVKYRVPRTLAVAIVFLLVILIISLLLFLLIPLLENQITIFISQLPDYFDWLQRIFLPWLNKYFGISPTFSGENFKKLFLENFEQASNIASMTVKTVTHSTFTLVDILIKIILVPVVAFYLLRDWNELWRGARSLLPRSIEPTAVRLTQQSNDVIGAFFRGQLLVMVSLGVYYSLSLTLLGLQLALLFGFIIGIISIVPYLGFTLGIVLTGFIAFFQFGDWLHIFYVLIIFGVGEVLESMILQPLLVGDRIGLHPVAVIFALLAGGNLFGFVGVLLALPVAAIIMVVLRYFHSRYKKSEAYQST